MANLKLGIAQVNYTPGLGVPLMGNFRTDYGARGVHDPLYARALVFQNSLGRKVAMVSVDICMLDRANVSLMRRFIASQTDLRPEDILIAATHTHSGPAPMKLGALPKADDATVEAFLTKAATAAILANQDLKPARLTLGTSREDRISFNRRLWCKDGKTHMNWEGLDPDFVVKPLGPIDPEVIALSIEQDRRPAAGVVNFAVHPAVLAGDNWLYSADLPGYLAEAMARLVGDQFITTFFNGCCGNVNHIDYRDRMQGRGYQMTQRIGYMLAVAAHRAQKESVGVEGDEIVCSREMIWLKRVKISEPQRKWSEDVLKEAKNRPPAGQVDGLPPEHYAETWLDMYQIQDTDDAVEVVAIRIGNVAIVGFPGEMFCEFGLEVKRSSPAPHTMVIYLANDAVGYLPTREAFDQGGYEPMVGSTFYEKGAGEELVASALRQLHRLFPK